MMVRVVIPETCGDPVSGTTKTEINFLLDGSIDVIITTGVLFTE
jgi:hypothetical protein